MSQELEIEFKNMLSEDEYNKLLSEFSVSEDQIITQENFYFDTHSFSLKEQGAALRIREKNGAYTLTLKQPVERGLLETHQSLSSEDANNMLAGGHMVEGEVSQIVKGLSIEPTQITFFGSLVTKRVEFEYKQGLLVLDVSTYLNKTDFEVEYEVTDEKIGQATFFELLEMYDIPARPSENKIRRFYNRKKQLLLGDNYHES